MSVSALMRAHVWWGWLLLVVAVPLLAEPSFPELSGRVVDEAHLLSASQHQQLDVQLAALEQGSSIQLVVVTLASLQGYSIEEFGYQLGRHWGIGQQAKNNGVLLLVAPNERKVRIEVGYGLEGQLTDAIASNIIRGRILPRFKQGDMPAGIAAGVTAISQVVAGDYQPVAQTQGQEAHSLLPFMLFVGIGLLQIFLQRWSGRRGGLGRSHGIYIGGRGSRSGRSGGGSFRGGGGGFGGGGASGGW